MADEDWTIPEELRPDPADYAYDLGTALGSVVALKSRVPADAFSARTLGTEREGSGVVIREDGLVLTIGYLVSESESIWITTAAGRVVPGHALAYDFETGFGLVQALGRLEAPAMPLGPAQTPEAGVQTVLAAAAGEDEAGAIACSIVAKEPFAGYWEYLLEEALFTAPAHPSWGGAALIGPDGKLLGIGSLVLQHRDKRGRRMDLNMCVPVALLHPILDDLLSYGRVNKPARPWLGVYAADQEEGVVVASVASKGPAERAGLRAGDRILSIEGHEATDLAGLWRSLWSCGNAGVKVTLSAERDGRRIDLAVASADRASFLKAPRLH
ncbi:signal protein PDZ [Falsiroseomonas bella]|uniref:Signal protein PDZ n=1 Tax=Falsiroseomonas bella TaxID=2184016 RepID=A0A317FCA9_9PROT|nr:S1C family serine protease [Falsiroseomonas bella]PWS36475.1 signal protein PDZ [Falsiroseomonas bella]